MGNSATGPSVFLTTRDSSLLRSIAQQAAAALLDTAATRLVRFQFGGVRVSPELLMEVGRRLQQGKYQVGWDPNRLCSYDPKTNRFSFDSLNLSQPNSRAVLVHEATHAVQDLSRLRMFHVDVEAGAYLAQVIYLRQNDPRLTAGGVVPADGTRLGNFKAALFMLGDKVLAGKPITDWDINNVRWGVLHCGVYGMGRRDQMVFDGA